MENERMPIVGLVMKSLSSEFFQFMQTTAEAYARKRGDFSLISVGTQTQTEVEKQIQLVDELIGMGVDALLIIPIDSRALVAPVVRAVEAGIKVINFDVMLDQELLTQHGIELAFLGPDNTEAAKVVGQVLGEKIQPASKVIILEGIREASNAQQRLEGFRQVVKEYDFIVLASQSANWESEQAYSLFSELLKKFPEIQGVMCANDAMASGVVRVLEENGAAREIQVVGIDNDASTKTLIENGSMLATIDLQTEHMVSLAIDEAMNSLNGRVSSGWIRTPTRLITRESE